MQLGGLVVVVVVVVGTFSFWGWRWPTGASQKARKKKKTSGQNHGGNVVDRPPASSLVATIRRILAFFMSLSNEQ